MASISSVLGRCSTGRCDWLVCRSVDRSVSRSLGRSVFKSAGQSMGWSLCSASVWISRRGSSSRRTVTLASVRSGWGDWSVGRSVRFIGRSVGRLVRRLLVGRWIGQVIVANVVFFGRYGFGGRWGRGGTSSRRTLTLASTRSILGRRVVGRSVCRKGLLVG